MTPREAEAAAIVMAAVTSEASGVARRSDALLDYATADGHLRSLSGDVLTAVDVAQGAAAVMGRVIRDVAVVAHLSIPCTVAAVGEWVAEHGVVSDGT